MVIVGSAPLRDDQSRFIDACDCVVRFNNCKNYGGNSGLKTDVLFLNPAGNPTASKTLTFMLKSRTEDEVRVELPYLTTSSHVWFTRPSYAPLSRFIETYVDDSNCYKRMELENCAFERDLAAEMIGALKIPDHKVHGISEEHFIRIWEKLVQLGPTDAIIPSTGIVGVEIILRDETFSEYEKFIVGFGSYGWAGHPWKLERKLLKDYIQREVLTPLDSREFEATRSRYKAFRQFLKSRCDALAANTYVRRLRGK